MCDITIHTTDVAKLSNCPSWSDNEDAESGCCEAVMLLILTTHTSSIKHLEAYRLDCDLSFIRNVSSWQQELHILSHISNTYLVPFSSCIPSGTVSPVHRSRSPLLFLSQPVAFPSSPSMTGKNVSHSNSPKTLVSNMRFASLVSREALYICAPPMTNNLDGELAACISAEFAAWLKELVTIFSPSATALGSPREMTIFVRSFRGRNLGGMLSQVLRPMMTVFIVWRPLSCEAQDRGVRHLHQGSRVL